MAREKQESYEFLSNLVLALMNTDRAFVNAFFMDELPISSKILAGIVPLNHYPVGDEGTSSSGHLYICRCTLGLRMRMWRM